MDIHLQKKKLFLLCLFLFSLFISACSNNAPNLRDLRVSLIFDYENKESLPQARMGIFVEAVSNPRRFGTLTVQSKNKDFVWETNKLLFANNSEQNYLGAVNFVMPQQEEFPLGEYNLSFVQEDEEKKDIKTYFSYDKAFYKAKPQEAVELMKKNMGRRMLKIYGEEKLVLYYGEWTSEFTDARSIWNQYRDAKEFQETWVCSTTGGSIICNFPVEKVSPGN